MLLKPTQFFLSCVVLQLSNEQLWTKIYWSAGWVRMHKWLLMCHKISFDGCKVSNQQSTWSSKAKSTGQIRTGGPVSPVVLVSCSKRISVSSAGLQWASSFSNNAHARSRGASTARSPPGPSKPTPQKKIHLVLMYLFCVFEIYIDIMYVYLYYICIIHH